MSWFKPFTWPDEIKGEYPVILADCPWQYEEYGHEGHGAARGHYSLMNQEALCALPVEKLAADPCALFLWATGPKLPEALEVCVGWGFEFKTVAFVWKKLGRMGLGSYTRSETEFVLLGIRGSGMTSLRQSASIRQVIEAPVGRHSEKPEEVAQKIEELFPGPYLELFARRRRDKWVVWGDEVE